MLPIKMEFKVIRKKTCSSFFLRTEVKPLFLVFNILQIKTIVEMINKDIKIAAYLNYFIYRFKPYY